MQAYFVASTRCNVALYKCIVASIWCNVAMHRFTVAMNLCNVAKQRYNVATQRYNVAEKRCNVAGERCNVATKRCNVACTSYDEELSSGIVATFALVVTGQVFGARREGVTGTGVACRETSKPSKPS